MSSRQDKRYSRSLRTRSRKDAQDIKILRRLPRMKGASNRGSRKAQVRKLRLDFL